MTVRDLMRALLDYPPDCTVYVGKGMGPAAKVEPGTSDVGVTYVIVRP